MTAPPTATGNGIRHGQRGVTYLIVLFLVALVGMGLAALGTVWQTEVQRDRERELLFIGEQFGVALKRFYDASPGVKEYPHRLEDLLEDRRHQVSRRHLRQIFPDPLTGKRDWVVIMVGGQVTAVRSRSEGVPIVHTGFPEDWKQFTEAHTHAEWIFTPLAPRPGTLQASVAPPNVPTPDVSDAPPPPSARARARPVPAALPADGLTDLAPH